MKTGQLAPQFELPDQSGTKRSLDELLADGPLVLFFYPAANTPVCTAEACHFRDLAGEFAALGASCAGISADAVDTQAGFADKQRLGYPLLSDPDGVVAEQFGVKRGLLGKLAPVKRQTFVIDTDRTVLTVVTGELRANVHADEALKFLRERAK
ncbi:peroxiredoxin [Nocardia cyriacigeorgica]|uniref:thioredoxin-dependent peroxiredoxin n=2 Tax=Nocardia cyriacigeorgica TaxID=135487 RepID=H6QZ48_NOCCG|nr:peroxiredoxin [Nocardia cyriacigeorgica]MBF6084232.1 peroxiredoxin [Nocardia cyriacigeorgica]MBF6286847.1 peroxiredoxin [Nocardia cyriacigeorgica]MBF6426640.1 peroxiredoxin [Nocardia cyriacigeorgica]NEW32328.1 peroxiredoxin [Nocardia cyriacigeorgica]CCF62802.1 putative peroxidoxin BcpB [Nocardia cyriacigeorgica GUH-2]